MIRTIRTDFGFTTVINNSFVDRVECYMRCKTIPGDPTAQCKVYLKDGTVRSTITIGDAAMAAQYGTPVSESGIMFVGGWYAKDGLRAYDVMTGEQIWMLKKPKVRNLFTKGDCVIVLAAGDGIYKLNIADGSVADVFKNTAVEHFRNIDDRYILADRIRSNLVLVDTDTMEIVKKYPPSHFNLNDSSYSTIRDAYLVDGKLEVEGFITVDEPNSLPRPLEFTKIIDDDFESIAKR